MPQEGCHVLTPDPDERALLHRPSSLVLLLACSGHVRHIMDWSEPYLQRFVDLSAKHAGIIRVGS